MTANEFNSADHPRVADGTFTVKDQTAPEVALVGSLPERTVLNADLQPGDVLVQGSSRIAVDNVEMSSAMPGFVAVETAFGTLYLDDEGESLVAAEDERSFEFTAETLDSGTFSDVYQMAKRKLGFSGTYFVRGDVDAALEEALDKEFDGVDVDPDAVWAEVKSGYLWRNLDDRFSELGNELVYDEVIETVRRLHPSL